MSHGAQLGAAARARLRARRLQVRPSTQIDSTSADETRHAAPRNSDGHGARTFAFDAPAQIPAGAVTLQLQESGQGDPPGELVKLDAGKTEEDRPRGDETARPAAGLD